VLIVLISAVLAGLATVRVGPAPEIRIEPSLPGIGRRTAIRVDVEEPRRGLGDLRVEFVQGDRVETLAERKHTPLAPWKMWGERSRSEQLAVEVGSETLKQLREGPATIRVSAARAGTWLRSPGPTVVEVSLPVKLRPPSIDVQSQAIYVSQGGCEAVVYRLGATAVRDGVRAGSWWFPGYPLPGSSDERRHFALFAAPYDLEDPNRIELVASDDIGNESHRKIVDQFFRRPFRSDKIQLTDSFMARVVPAVLAESSELADRGSLLANYLEINGDLRKRNAQTLIELAGKSAPEFLWTRTFVPLPNAKVMSDFADRRSYVYEGREVDRQDHLGFDLASTQAAEVPAANDGVVALARYFGIYGNTVVIDHGYGLMSLYGHLSVIDVKEGEKVRRGTPIGRTGQTGLAGGDHLHFTMLLAGLPIDPREWWDPHWIQDRLERKLEQALPFQD